MERERSPAGLKIRLSLLAVLVFSIPGALLPGYSNHLEHGLGFGPIILALCSATQGIASLFATFFGQLADRVLSIRSVLTLCSVGISGSILGLILFDHPAAVFFSTLVYWALTIPTWVMASAMMFTLLKNPEEEFGPVRMWGTVGWMAAGWSVIPLLGFFPQLREGTGVHFRVAFLLSLCLFFYSLSLPNRPPQKKVGRHFAPTAALRILWGKSFGLYSLCVFGISVSQPFSVQGTPLLLKELGIATEWLMPALTLSQVTEAILAMILSGVVLRLGLKGTMGTGLAAWTLSLTILSVSNHLGLALGSLPLNGLVITLFLISGSIWVNSRTPDDVRASVQTVIVTIQGLGMCLGHLLMGWIRFVLDLESSAEELRWCFLVGAVLNGGLAALFFWGFDPNPSLSLPETGTSGHSSPQTSSKTSSET